MDGLVIIAVALVFLFGKLPPLDFQWFLWFMVGSLLLIQTRSPLLFLVIAWQLWQSRRRQPTLDPAMERISREISRLEHRIARMEMDPTRETMGREIIHLERLICDMRRGL